MPRSLPRLLAFAAIVGLTATAGAQTPREVHTGIAAGAALGQGRSDPGFALLGSVNVGRSGSRLAARGELLYTHASRDLDGLLGVPCAACSALVPYSHAERTDERFGALLGATYEVAQATRARPYLLGGLGVYRTQSRFEGTVGSPCPPGAMCIQPLVEPYTTRTTERGTGVGMHVGVGGALRVGQLDLTAEARYHVLERGVGSRRVIPLTLGVRF